MAEITTHPAEGVWTVRTPDGVLVESRNAVILREGDYPEVVYFPRDDIAMALLEPSDTTSRCPFKGDATYYHYVGPSEQIQDVAWTYEAPDQDSAKPIAGYLAFYGNKVTVEQL